MKVVWGGTHAGLSEAADFVSSLSDNEDFWTEVSAIEVFDHSTLSGSEVAELLRAHETPVPVRLYSKFWPFHRHTNAYVDESDPTYIRYNKNKLWRSVEDMVDTLAHEFVHVVDYCDLDSPQIDYGHRGNSSHGNENTAPYRIGHLARRFYLEG